MIKTFRAFNNLPRRCIELYAWAKDGRNHLVPSEITFTTREQEGIAPEPLLRLDEREAQEIMDSLWSAGIRPVECAGSVGQLAATEKHLEDMRKLSDKLLTKVLA